MFKIALFSLENPGFYSKISAAPIFRGSSMVEQEAVNFEVAGSSPARGATYPIVLTGLS